MEKITTVAIVTKTGKHVVAFTEDGKYVRMADMIKATGNRSGYSVANLLSDILEEDLTITIKDSEVHTHKYVDIRKMITEWDKHQAEVMKRQPSAGILANFRSFMKTFKDIMLGLRDRFGRGESIEVEEHTRGSASPSEIDISIDIIMKELGKLEQLKDVIVDSVDVTSKITYLEDQLILAEKKYQELKKLNDDISLQRDNQIKANQELKEKNRRLIKALEA